MILMDEGQGKSKKAFSFIGKQEAKTWGIISQNITHNINIGNFVLRIYIWKMTYLKIDHKIIQKWANAVLTPINTVAIKLIHKVAIIPKCTVLKGCANVIHMYGHTNTTTLTYYVCQSGTWKAVQNKDGQTHRRPEIIRSVQTHKSQQWPPSISRSWKDFRQTSLASSSKSSKASHHQG